MHLYYIYFFIVIAYHPLPAFLCAREPIFSLSVFITFIRTKLSSVSVWCAILFCFHFSICSFSNAITFNLLVLCMTITTEIAIFSWSERKRYGKVVTQMWKQFTMNGDLLDRSFGRSSSFVTSHVLLLRCQILGECQPASQKLYHFHLAHDSQRIHQKRCIGLVYTYVCYISIYSMYMK